MTNKPNSRSEEDSNAEERFTQGHHEEFFGYMERSHRSEIIRFLSFRFGLSTEEAQDCYAIAIESVCEKIAQRNVPLKPIGYIVNAAKFNAIDTLQIRGRYRVSALDENQIRLDDDPDEALAEHTVLLSNTSNHEINDEAAAVIIEDLDPEADLDEGWAALLIREAITYLTNTEQIIINTLLTNEDFDFEKNQYIFTSSDAMRELSMTAASFRKAKSRAFKRLKILIPKILQSLEITVPRRVEESIFHAQWSEPSSDD